MVRFLAAIRWINIYGGKWFFGKNIFDFNFGQRSTVQDTNKPTGDITKSRKNGSPTAIFNTSAWALRRFVKVYRESNAREIPVTRREKGIFWLTVIWSYVPKFNVCWRYALGKKIFYVRHRKHTIPTVLLKSKVPNMV